MTGPTNDFSTYVPSPDDYHRAEKRWLDAMEGEELYLTNEQGSDQIQLSDELSAVIREAVDTFARNRGLRIEPLG